MKMKSFVNSMYIHMNSQEKGLSRRGKGFNFLTIYFVF